MDKKRLSKQMRFVLMSKLGKGEIVEIPLTVLKKYLIAFNTLNKKQK
jgi:3-dehydroquinate synthetase